MIKLRLGNRIWKTGLKIGSYWLSWHKFRFHVYNRATVVKAQKREFYA